MTKPEAIKKLRLSEGYSQVAFAALMGISYQTYSNWEAGRFNVPFKRLEQMADITGHKLIVQRCSKNTTCIFAHPETDRKSSFDTDLTKSYSTLFSYCLKHLCHTLDDAKELTQRTMYAALKNHATYIPEGPILTWLIGIAKNMNRTRIKRETNSKLVFVENYIETDHLTDDIEDYFRENKDVFAALESLPDNHKKAYQLSLIGYSYRDIAKQLGTTEKYVKTMMGKNKRKLLSIIENHADNN